MGESTHAHAHAHVRTCAWGIKVGWLDSVVVAPVLAIGDVVEVERGTEDAVVSALCNTRHGLIPTIALPHLHNLYESVCEWV